MDNSLTAVPTLTVSSIMDSFRNDGGPVPATFSMSAGVLNTGRFRLSQDGNYSVVTITGGTVNQTGSKIEIGYNSGRAVFNLGGAAVYQGSPPQIQMSVGSPNGNSFANFYGNSTAKLDSIFTGDSNGWGSNGQDSTISVADNASVTMNWIILGNSVSNNGHDGASPNMDVVNQSGGIVTINGQVTLAGNKDSSDTGPKSDLQGTYNLGGGTFNARQIVGGTGGTGGQARLNFHGGTLQVNAGANNGQLSNFITLNNDGTDGAAVIYEGGTIDTNGQAVTINQPLLAATGNGVSSIAVSASGSSYFVPPSVHISGDGTAHGRSQHRSGDGRSHGHHDHEPRHRLHHHSLRRLVWRRGQRGHGGHGPRLPPTAPTPAA